MCLTPTRDEVWMKDPISDRVHQAAAQINIICVINCMFVLDTVT